MTPFDPVRLPPTASINRVVLDGREAREVLSARGLRELVGEAGLQPDGPVRSYLDARADEAAVSEVADRFAARLSGLLHVLRSGQRAARPEWDDTWWQRWAATTTVWLGGGLMGGPFGRLVLERTVVPGCRVELPGEPALLPLVGAGVLARRLAGTVVLDFGHTAVKRAIVDRAGMRLLESVEAPPMDASAGDVANAVLQVLRSTWAEAGRPSGPLVASIASYTSDGQPVHTQLGTYVRLGEVSEDVQRLLGEQLGRRVVLIHDGTAAALAVPPDPRSVVVLLGTSLGVGFPDPRLRELSQP